jgi:hypothetical protein
MAHFLALADRREHRQHSFHHPPRVPGATWTDFHVAGCAGLRMESRIVQTNQRVDTLGNQRVKRCVVDVGGGAVPGTHQAPLMQDETEFAAANPARMARPLLAALGWAAPFPHGVDHVDAVAVRPPKTVGAAQKRAVHAVWVFKSRATRVRSGTCGNNGGESHISQ